MRPKELLPLLVHCLKAGEQILVKGPPGYGKTDIWKQACAQAGFKLILSHPAVAEPVDYRGFPSKSDDGTHATFLPFGQLWEAINAQEPTLFLVDDVGQSAEGTLKALMQLLHGRRLNGYTLPDWVVFGGATNDVKQQSGVMGIIEPVKSRFSSIVEIEGHSDDWCEWALDAGVPVHLVAFMRSAESVLPSGKHCLYNFAPTKALTNSGCPRTWTALGRLQNAGIRDLEVWKGAVGEASAMQYWSWLQVAEKAPDLDAILADPAGAPVPDLPSLRYLVAAGLSRRLVPGNMDRAMTYLQRLDQSYRTLTLTDMHRRVSKAQRAGKLRTDDDPRLTTTYQRWALGEGKDILGGLKN